MKKLKKEHIIILILILLLLMGFIFYNIMTSSSAFESSFNANGGTMTSTPIIDDDGYILYVEDPVRDGYVFDGWYLGDELFDFSKPLGDDEVLDAHWTSDEDVVTGLLDGLNDLENSLNGTGDDDDLNFDLDNETNSNDGSGNDNSNGSGSSSSGSNSGSSGSNSGSSGSSGSTDSSGGSSGSSGSTDSSGGSTDSSGGSTGDTSTEEEVIKYSIKFSKIDDYSPDRTVSIYYGSDKVSVTEVKYSDGTLLCTSSNMTVSYVDIIGESSFLIKLSDGSVITAYTE